MDIHKVMRLIGQIDDRLKEIKTIHGLSEAETELLIQLYSLIATHTSWSAELRIKLLRAIGTLEEAMQDVYFINEGRKP